MVNETDILTNAAAVMVVRLRLAAVNAEAEQAETMLDAADLIDTIHTRIGQLDSQVDLLNIQVQRLLHSP
jgi:hypothetical protein